MFDRQKFINESLTESAETKRLILEECSDDINRACDAVRDAIKSGKKILFCGNGGSAADAQHLATEFMIRMSHDIKRPAIGAIALTTDTSNITAGGNDLGFDNVFARNVEGLGNEGDILVAISTSGTSPNVVKAVEKAKSKGMVTIGFLGRDGGSLLDMVDISIVIPSNNTQRIQEGH